MNRVWLIGNVGKAPEARGHNRDIASFSLAVNQRLKGGEKSTMWVHCVAFGKTGSSILEHVRVGSHLAICGKLKMNEYERDGISRKDLDVIIDSWEFIGPRPTERSPISNQGDASWQNRNSWQS
jgi:single stranded DNA-binding protein|tara:strand:+ start:767 stop:1138 length:372 start_codon:yes stop_codon:yes gene_type:complete